MPRSDANAAASVERFFQFALLGLVASGFLAVVGSGFLDLPAICLTWAAFLARALAIGGVLRLNFSERAVTVAVTLYAAFFIADLFLLSRDLLPALVHLALFLAVVKLLTAKTGRDHASIASFAFIELLAAALLSITPNFFLSLSLFLLFAMAALPAAEMRRSMERAAVTARCGPKRVWPRLGVLSGLIAVGILVLTVALFFVLPRTAEAAFSRFSRRTIVAGFSNQVTLGQIGAIKTVSEPVMHIRVFGASPQSGLKWRGAALGDFDGKRWFNLDGRRLRVPLDEGHGRLGANGFTRGTYLNYQVWFDALDGSALFFAGNPETIDLRASHILLSAEGAYSLDFHPSRGFRYEAYSRVDEPPDASAAAYPPPVLRLESRERYLRLPSGLDSRIAGMARSIAQSGATDLQRARAIENALRRDRGYTLKLPQRDTADPLADFLFERKEGHCEYFAAAMAVMLRTVDVPSRLVTGFQSGEYNPLTGLWVVRASDAHAWVEAWIPGFGWTPFDPTPPSTDGGQNAFLALAGLYLDAAQTFWSDWVLGYDVRRQGTLADRIERGARGMGIRWFDAFEAVRSGWRSYSGAVSGGLLVRIAAVLASVFLLWYLIPRLVRLLRVRHRVERVRRGEAVASDATILYERMLQALKRQGFQKPGWYTPTEFAASLPAPVGQAVTEFTSAYNALRFGGRTEAAPLLSMLLDDLERRP